MAWNPLKSLVYALSATAASFGVWRLFSRFPFVGALFVGSATVLAMRRNRIFLKNIPFPPRGFLGNVGKFETSNMMAYFEYWAAELGPIFQVDLIIENVVVLSDQTAIRELAKTAPNKVGRSSAIISTFGSFDIHGLFSVGGDLWRKSRKPVASAFTKTRVKNMHPAVIRQLDAFKSDVADFVIKQGKILESFFDQNATNGYVVNFKPSQLMDFAPIVQKFTLRAVVDAAFGIQGIDICTDEFIKMVPTVFKSIGDRADSILPWYKLCLPEQDKVTMKFLKICKDYTESVIDKYYSTRAKVKQGVLSEDPFKDTVLEKILQELEENEGRKVTQKATIDQVKGDILHLMVAGIETTALSIQTFLYFACKHPEYLKRAQDEVDNILGKFPEPESFAGRSPEDFPFITNMLNESMRLLPIAPQLYLSLIDDATILGHHLPKGTTIISLNRFACLRACTSPNPLDFNPDRWSELDSIESAQISMPFGYGPRICPGRNLAMVEMIYAIAFLMGHYDFSFFPQLHSQPPATEITSFTCFIANFYPKLSPRK